MIRNIDTNDQKLSELHIGFAIILGLLLFLFCCEISFEEDQEFMSQYSMILQTHESIMLMSKQYKQLFQEYRNFTRLLYEVVVKINNNNPTLHRTMALVNLQKEVYPETQGTRGRPYMMSDDFCHFLTPPPPSSDVLLVSLYL